MGEQSSPGDDSLKAKIGGNVERDVNILKDVQAREVHIGDKHFHPPAKALTREEKREPPAQAGVH